MTAVPAATPATNAPLPPPFPAQPEETPWHWLPSTVLEKCFAEFVKKPPFSNMGLALVDLTHAPRDSGHANVITYAGWRDQEQFYAASLPKITIILAAYRLLASVRAAAEQIKTGDAVAEITKAWSPIVSRRIRDRPADFPVIERVLDVRRAGTSWSVDFTGPFMDQLIGIVENDNAAANYCIDAIGYQYINGTLIHEGLYDEKKKRGLWLGGGYSKVATWGSEPRYHGATASSVAKLLTLLHTGRLVSPNESFGMRGLLGLALEWFTATLWRYGNKPQEAIGKIGYQFAGAPKHEGAIVTRKDGSRELRYVAVILNAPWHGSGFNDAILKLDDCIAARHARMNSP